MKTPSRDRTVVPGATQWSTILRPALWTRWLGAAVLGWFLVGTVSWLVRPGSPAHGLFAATITLAILSFGVWHLTGRLPWPERPGWLFLLAHAVLGTLFAALLVAADYWAQPPAAGATVGDFLRRSLRGDLGIGLWLYVLVAGVSYAQRLHDRVAAERQAAAEAKERASLAQLEALRGQLNPHFLFNALHSISALVPTDGPAAAALERLGDLLRYVLDDEADEDVTLAEEWRFTRDYLELERLCVGDRLQVTAQIEPETLAIPVPSFALQTLVENAARHGIGQLSAGGAIDIEARHHGDTVELTVRNDVPTNDLAAPTASATGVGLVNLGLRLQARYGDRARLESSPAEPGRWVAVLTVPVQKTVSVQKTLPVQNGVEDLPR